MSEITGSAGRRGTATAVVNESYSFACLRCGHGWEQSYEIEHHTNGDGNEFVLYVADGRVVPSPLSRPNCTNCDGHVIRIMRAGRVSSAQSRQSHPHRTSPSPPQSSPSPSRSQSPSESPSPSGEETAGRKRDGRPEHHHWHLSDLLHPFHRRTG